MRATISEMGPREDATFLTVAAHLVAGLSNDFIQFWPYYYETWFWSWALVLGRENSSKFIRHAIITFNHF